MTYKKWEQEDYDLLQAMCENEYTNAEMALELGRSIDSVALKKSRLGLQTKSSKGGRPKEYTKEQLIKIMRSAPEICYNYFNSKESGLPAATTYREYFGSWTAALSAAGVRPTENTPKGRSVQKPDKPTTLYIVEFEDFYKIGITQQTVHQRLGGRYPVYTIRYTKDYPTLHEAKQEEAKLLDSIKHNKYIPTNFPVEGRGFTECFKMPKNEFEDFLQKML